MDIELIKQTEDPLVEFRGNSNAIITDKDNRWSLRVFQAANLNSRGRFGSGILCGIIDQILHDFHQPNTIAVYDGKVLLYSNLNLLRFQLAADSLDGLANNLLKGSFLRSIHDTPNPGQFEQVVEKGLHFLSGSCNAPNRTPDSFLIARQGILFKKSHETRDRDKR